MYHVKYAIITKVVFSKWPQAPFFKVTDEEINCFKKMHIFQIITYSPAILPPTTKYLLPTKVHSTITNYCEVSTRPKLIIATKK